MGSEMCIRDSMFPALDLYRTDPAQPLKAVGEYLNDIDRNLSDAF